jgi:hypothetical protein
MVLLSLFRHLAKAQICAIEVWGLHKHLGPIARIHPEMARPPGWVRRHAGGGLSLPARSVREGRISPCERFGLVSLFGRQQPRQEMHGIALLTRHLGQRAIIADLLAQFNNARTR